MMTTVFTAQIILVSEKKLERNLLKRGKVKGNVYDGNLSNKKKHFYF